MSYKVFIFIPITKTDKTMEKQFCKKYGIEMNDLINRVYMVDSTCNLREFLKVNSESFNCNILELDNYLSMNEIINLKVGETFVHGMGCDIKRIF